MKKRTLIILPFLMASVCLFAQKGKNNSASSPAGLLVNGDESQEILIKPFEDATKIWRGYIDNSTGKIIDVYLVDKPEGLFIGHLNQPDNSFGVSEHASEQARIIRLAGRHTSMIYPHFFVDNRYGEDKELFLNNLWIRLERTTGKDLLTVRDINENAYIPIIYGISKKDIQDLDYQKIKTMMIDYVNKCEQKTKESMMPPLERFGLAGKSIKSARIDCDIEEIMYGESGAFNIETTLEDGTIINTNMITSFELFTDYIITVQGFWDGGKYGQNGHFGYGTFTLNQKMMEGPELKIIAKCKHDTTIVAEKIIRIKDENKDGTPFSFNHHNQYSGAGEDAYVRISQFTTEDGTIMLQYYIADAMSLERPLWMFVCRPETPVHLNVGGSVKGTDGGNIDLYVDPNITVPYKFTYNTKGMSSVGYQGEEIKRENGKVKRVDYYKGY